MMPAVAYCPTPRLRDVHVGKRSRGQEGSARWFLSRPWARKNPLPKERK